MEGSEMTNQMLQLFDMLFMQVLARVVDSNQGA